MSRPKNPKPPLDADDTALWKSFQQHVRPLKKKKETVTPELCLARPARRTPAIVSPTDLPILKPSMHQGTLLYQGTRKLGRLQVQARLDLHGYRQDAAYQALSVFIQRAALQGHKNLLVITGKGKIASESNEARPSVLREMLPRWLEDSALRPYVHFYAPAHATDGGTGAFYIVLRRLSK